MKFKNKTDYMIFDVYKRPELALTIHNRLMELGFLPGEDRYTPYVRNISVNYDGKFRVHFGCASVKDSMWDGYTLLTLSDLFDIPPTSFTIVIDGKEVKLSKESFNAIKEALNL